MIFGLILIKYLLYYGVCRLAIRLLPLQISDAAPFAMKWAAVRLAMGLIFGFFIFLGYVDLTSAGFSERVSYILSFGVARYFEWLIMLYLISKRHNVSISLKSQRWVLLGTIANLVVDQIAIAAGFTNLRFFC